MVSKIPNVYFFFFIIQNSKIHMDKVNIMGYIVKLLFNSLPRSYDKTYVNDSKNRHFHHEIHKYCYSKFSLYNFFIGISTLFKF